MTKIKSWRFLGLERPRQGSRFRWRDRIFNSLGLALGVFFLILSWGFLSPLEALVKQKVLGSLPDRIRATASKVSLGPIAMGSQIEAETPGQIENLEDVVAVYRQAHFPEPCQLSARYAGEGLVTDLVLELADPGLVSEDVAPDYEFKDPGEGKDVPAIVPRAILDLVNSGISVNTELPNLTESALIGKHFTLHIGTSSFRPGQSVSVRCVVVGVSDQIGAGGPAIPLEVGQRLTDAKPLLHALTLKLRRPEDSAKVAASLHRYGLRASRLELATKVSAIAFLLKILGLALPLAVLAVTTLGLASLLELQVVRERSLIALYRSLGASRRNVEFLYLSRALSVAAVGFVLGTVGATLSGWTLARYLESVLPEGLIEGIHLFAPSPLAFALSFVFCFGLAIVAGWIPARKAASIDPAEVFREPG